MSLPDIPSHLTIRILHSDKDIIVIEKPCDLRSVPGHADLPPPEKDRPRPRPRSTAVEVEAGEGGDANTSVQSHRRTAQEAWVKAIQMMSKMDKAVSVPTESVADNKEISTEDAAVEEVLLNLSSTANPSCVPRKLETFVKYCHRNSKRLIPSFPDLHHDRGNVALKKGPYEPVQKKQKRNKSSVKQKGLDEVSPTMRKIAQMSHSKIQQKQRPLMNLPKPTEDWESAIGQLKMLGFGDYSHVVSATADDSGDTQLHVVHRLDCQTSGIMVVARNHIAASTLCQAWREREIVKKIYLAHVKSWPPYHEKKEADGTIDISLAPSRTERIKWQVCPVAEGGKECKTNWRVYRDLDDVTSGEEEQTQQKSSRDDKRGLTLELVPVTGRTHQLRLHCAAMGSGIVGDSLYGDSPIKWFRDARSNNAKLEQVQAGGTGTNSKAETDVPKTLRLHAHRLTFPHPRSGERVTFESPKPW